MDDNLDENAKKIELIEEKLQSGEPLKFSMLSWLVDRRQQRLSEKEPNQSNKGENMFDIKNNPEFLQAIGIANASEDVKEKLIAGIEDLAQKKLTIKLADKITEEKAEEFSQITDETEAKTWLEQNVPDFPNMVTEVFEEIKNDILAHKANVVG